MAQYAVLYNYLQVVTTGIYDTVTDSHTLKITPAHTKPSQSVIRRFLVTASNGG
jgi:hypothetical protein